MNIISVSRAVTVPKKCRVTLVAALVSLLASHPVHALPTSFPQYPLQTGFSASVPPNVMLILDDSGSMAWQTMPADAYWINYGGNFRYRTDARTLTTYDKPQYRSYSINVIYYNPNVEYKPWRTDSLPPSQDRKPNADFKSVSDHVYNLTGSISLVNSPLAYFYVPKSRGGYNKYRIGSSTGPGSYNGAVVQRCTLNNCTNENQWASAVAETPTGRSQQDELQNIANWFHYHSSRMKMAKAGASEAFGQLGENYRVGYDQINRGSRGIMYKIPYNNNKGLFSGTNRTQFFEKLWAAGEYANTPLKTALARVGTYYTTIEPYKDGDNSEPLSCRRNYAVLTTDGAWNDDPVKVGGKTVNNLVSIAHHFYHTDLRSDLKNDVPSTSKPMQDDANWQHMNLFGISIGMGGTLTSTPNPPTGKWPTSNWPNNNPQKIDDLIYATSEGRGEFFLASNTKEFADALSEAFASIDARTASATNTTSAGNMLKNELYNFTTTFNSGTWLGDIIALQIKIDNSKKVDLDKNTGWKLSSTFTTVNANFSSRTILTRYGGTAQLFTKNTITDAVFGRSSGNAAVSVADNIDYLRGVSSKEVGGQGGSLRQRNGTPMGDIVNSSPFYALDSDTLYVGANDGMLHGLEAQTGKVLFSYVPKGINAEGMASLSSPQYEHRFLVDGAIDVSTKKITDNKNILIAALGRGGRGVFALDVTDPHAMGVAQALWDNTTQDTTTDPDMGYVLGRIRIRSGNGDKTWALVPNGIESPNGHSVLFAYELDADGNIAQTHRLKAGTGPDNGLMSLGMADINGDGAIDIVYGGDLKGNLWRWDFSKATPEEATLLFSTDGQPITGGITNARNPVTEEIFVGFGTGRFIDEDDLPTEAPQIQSIYGIVDSTTTVKQFELQERDIEISRAKNQGDEIRAFQKYEELPPDKKGWFLNLPAEERVISDPSMMGSEAMLIATVIPPDPDDSTDCESVAGTGYLNAINLFTGTSPLYKPGGGGYFSSYDPINLTSVEVVTVGSVRIDGGMPTAPNVICDENSCQVVAEPGTGDLTTRDGAELAAAAVEPHRLQWRSLR